VHKNALDRGSRYFYISGVLQCSEIITAWLPRFYRPCAYRSRRFGRWITDPFIN